jgi:hypothetical protein
MANIQVKDLTRSSIPGLDLFNDLENFIQDLSDDELDLQGGGYYRTVYRPTVDASRIYYV